MRVVEAADTGAAAGAVLEVEALMERSEQARACGLDDVADDLVDAARSLADAVSWLVEHPDR